MWLTDAQRSVLKPAEFALVRQIDDNRIAIEALGEAMQKVSYVSTDAAAEIGRIRDRVVAMHDEVLGRAEDVLQRLLKANDEADEDLALAPAKAKASPSPFKRIRIR